MRLASPALAAALCTACLCASPSLVAAALSPEEIARLCANAEGLAHCGRLVEELQMQRAPGLAARTGDVLTITLYPAGRVAFADDATVDGGRAYALWEYLDTANLVVLYVTRGDDASFQVLQRASGRTVEVPAEPKLSPDRQRLATADFCTEHCTNAVAVWRVRNDRIDKEATWSPAERWTDASVGWKNADTLQVEYRRAADALPRTIERRLGDAGWTRIAAP